MKKIAPLALTALLLLTSCGRQSAVLPGIPDAVNGITLPSDPGYYDPGQGNGYNPNPNTPGFQPGNPQSQSPTYVSMSNVFLRMDPELGVTVKSLEGILKPKRAGDPVIFDDITSFVTQISRAEMIIDEKNITTLKNKYTFNFPDSPIKDVSISFLPGRLRMSGKLKQVVWVPFSMEGTISPTADGKLKLVPDDIRTAGIPVKSLLKFIGLTTSKLISISSERGLTFAGNDVLLDPSLLFPPPRVEGRIVAAEITQGQMRIVFAGGQPNPRRALPDPGAPNYMHVYGGNVLIMNELQYGAEMQMVDMRPESDFDFYMQNYRQQLQAGYVKVVNDKGTLITLMPDYKDINNNSGVWDGYPGGKPNLRPYQSPAGQRQTGQLSHNPYQ